MAAPYILNHDPVISNPKAEAASVEEGTVAIESSCCDSACFGCKIQSKGPWRVELYRVDFGPKGVSA